MRLLFINRFFHPDQSATARLLTDLTEGLAAQGYDVMVITGRAGYFAGERLRPNIENYKGVIVRRVWSTRFGRCRLLGRAVDCLSFFASASWATWRTKKIDCFIVLSDPPLLSTLSAVIGRLKRWKTICWLQDVFPENAVRAGLLPAGWASRTLRRIAAWSLQTTDCTVVVGRCMERHLRLMGGPPRRVVLIPNWADRDALTPVPRDDNWFRDRHGLNGQLVVMYAGNLGVVHDTESLVCVIRHLQGVPQVSFLFMGYGQGRNRLETVARREGFTNLTLLGFQTHHDLCYSLSAGDVHVVTLRADMEGLSVPSKVYGIMAIGRPIIYIGPEGSEAAAVIRDAGCGEVYAPEESQQAALAIRDLAYRRDRAERLGTSGRQYFAKYLDKKFALERFKTVLRSME
jgi:colanic acid biosynthesis glycosyl transferase WcaI